MPKSTEKMLELIAKVESSTSLIRSGKDQDLIDELIDMVDSHDRELSGEENDLKNSMAKLKQLLEECQSERDSISCKLNQHALDKEKIRKLKGKRVGIIGGHVSDIRKIEAMLDQDLGIKSKATAGEGSPPPYSILKEKHCSADLLIILTGYAGHALTGNAEQLSKEFGIKKIYDSADLLNSIKLKVIEALA
ncbi:hypothetical protein [Pseudomonas sp. GOM6]|uniref:hypothetical protein n=1 Tax=Pseudomonas sp. GOM6 TaxID=3036944 RepID=UPI00240918FA|nr:hypothetical protein [Pseudomonas sp. GOM6]MDG1581277.1 hypothetical protein [Pseudomonas sp. GOM6]